mmetsp:Transcript_22760/g.37468  ORF Transcript_22760/g.37468 Transcript_22760/m.37468 type:complete len:293 (-) Transcript_22760:286-1164(-)
MAAGPFWFGAAAQPGPHHRSAPHAPPSSHGQRQRRPLLPRQLSRPGRLHELVHLLGGHQALLGPVQRRHHRAEHHDARRLHPVLLRQSHDGGDLAEHEALLGRAGLLDDGHGAVGRVPLRGQVRAERGQPAHRHQEDGRALRVVRRDAGLGAVLAIARANHELVGEAAVCEGDVAQQRRAEGRGHARHQLRLVPPFAKAQDLFPATAEDQGVPDLQAHHPLPCRQPLLAPVIDLLLGLLSATRPLARNFQLTLHKVEDLLGNKAVGNNQVCPLQPSDRSNSEKLRVSWSSSN